MKYNPRFQLEGQFSYQQNAVYRKEETMGIPNSVQNFWRFRHDFEQSMFAYYTLVPGLQPQQLPKHVNVFLFPLKRGMICGKIKWN